MLFLNFFLLLGLTNAAYIDLEWSKFKAKFNKVYSSIDEELLRKEIWLKKFNYFQKFDKLEHSFSIEINENTDLIRKKENFGSLFKTYGTNIIASTVRNIPDSFDWRENGVIGPVINQGQSGDVVHIVAEECIQSLHAIQSGKLEELSMAQFVDCCGQLEDPFQCIANKTGGLCYQGDYPKPLGVCQKGCKIVAPVKGGIQLPSGNETALLYALLEVPVFVGIDASQSSFELYQAGIYNDPSCSNQIDHALQLVGYGVEKGVNFWIARNSWGNDWGENGYIRIKRGVNMCGIASFALQPY